MMQAVSGAVTAKVQNVLNGDWHSPVSGQGKTVLITGGSGFVAAHGQSDSWKQRSLFLIVSRVLEHLLLNSGNSLRLFIFRYLSTSGSLLLAPLKV
jgi:hypothetical protein